MLEAFYICVLNHKKDGYDESNVLRDIIKRICKNYGISLKDATDYHSVGKITDDVKNAIEVADLVFADANSENENVWYEIGYADRVNSEKVICLSKTGRDLPFDRAQVRSIKYSENEIGLKELEVNLSKMVVHIISDGFVVKVLNTATSSSIELMAKKLSVHFSTNEINDLGRKLLETICRDSRKNDIDRMVSIRALQILCNEDISDEVLLDITRPHVNEKVAAYTYERLYYIKRPVMKNIWEHGIVHDSSIELKKSYAKTVAMHWLRGTVDDVWFRLNIINSSDVTLKYTVLDLIRSPQNDNSNNK